MTERGPNTGATLRPRLAIEQVSSKCRATDPRWAVFNLCRGDRRGPPGKRRKDKHRLFPKQIYPKSNSIPIQSPSLKTYTSKAQLDTGWIPVTTSDTSNCMAARSPNAAVINSLPSHRSRIRVGRERSAKTHQASGSLPAKGLWVCAGPPCISSTLTNITVPWQG